MDEIFQRHYSPMLLVDPDSGEIIATNPAAQRFYGYSAEEFLSLGIGQINMLSAAEIQVEMQLAATEQRNYFLFRHQLASGEVRDVEVHSSPIEREGRSLLFSIIYDVTESQHIEAVRDSMLRALPLPLYYKDMDGRYLGCNDAFLALTGSNRDEFLGKTVFDLWDPWLASKYNESDQELIQEAVELQEYESQILDVEGKRRDVVFHKALIRNRHGKAIGVVGAILDITDRKRNEELTRQLAYRDTLTGLANRRMILQRLEQTLVCSAVGGLYGALLFMDLDNFKPVNDLYGHDAGDQLLIEVAERLRDTVRLNDSVGRLGGDEFVLILEALGKDYQQSREQAEKLAEKLRDIVGEEYRMQGFQHSCSASIGVVMFQGEDISKQELLRRADLAMYRAKSSGRNRVCFYSPEEDF